MSSNTIVAGLDYNNTASNYVSPSAPTTAQSIDKTASAVAAQNFTQLGQLKQGNPAAYCCLAICCGPCVIAAKIGQLLNSCGIVCDYSSCQSCANILGSDSPLPPPARRPAQQQQQQHIRPVQQDMNRNDDPPSTTQTAETSSTQISVVVHEHTPPIVAQPAIHSKIAALQANFDPMLRAASAAATTPAPIAAAPATASVPEQNAQPPETRASSTSVADRVKNWGKQSN